MKRVFPWKGRVFCSEPSKTVFEAVDAMTTFYHIIYRVKDNLSNLGRPTMQQSVRFTRIQDFSSNTGNFWFQLHCLLVLQVMHTIFHFFMYHLSQVYGLFFMLWRKRHFAILFLLRIVLRRLTHCFSMIRWIGPGILKRQNVNGSVCQLSIFSHVLELEVGIVFQYHFLKERSYSPAQFRPDHFAEERLCELLVYFVWKLRKCWFLISWGAGLISHSVNIEKRGQMRRHPQLWRGLRESQGNINCLTFFYPGWPLLCKVLWILNKQGRVSRKSVSILRKVTNLFQRCQDCVKRTIWEHRAHCDWTFKVLIRIDGFNPPSLVFVQQLFNIRVDRR